MATAGIEGRILVLEDEGTVGPVEEREKCPVSLFLEEERER